MFVAQEFGKLAELEVCTYLEQVAEVLAIEKAITVDITL
jgi:hypothetical protein